MSCGDQFSMVGDEWFPKEEMVEQRMSSCSGVVMVMMISSCQSDGPRVAARNEEATDAVCLRNCAGEDH